MEYKYKYLHICPPSTRMLKNYAVMLQKYFNIDDHHFLCRVQSNGGDGFTVLLKNVTNFNDLGKGKIRKFFALRREFSQAQTIIIHGFMFPLPWLIFLFFHKQFLKKAVWIIWGVDIYNYHREKGNVFVNKIINHMEDEVRKAVKTPVIVFPTDYPVYRKIFGEDGKPVMCAPLGTPDSVFDEWDELIAKRQAIYDKFFRGDRNSPKREKSIQVGHNAFPFNKHGEILTQLERFKKEKIKITLPLSYGNDYGDTSTVYVKNIEGLIRNLSMTNICRILTKLMPKSQYFEFLSAVDVAILNADRQNALGNILPLLYMGKKIYLSEHNPLYKFFRDEGFEIHNTDELQSSSYGDFIEPTRTPYPDPWVRTFYSILYCAKKWEVVFGYNEGRYTKEKALSLMKEIENEQKAVVKEKREALNNDALTHYQQRLLGEEYAAVAEWLERRYNEDQKIMEEKRKRKEEWNLLRENKVKELLEHKEALNNYKSNFNKLDAATALSAGIPTVPSNSDKSKAVPAVELYFDKRAEVDRDIVNSSRYLIVYQRAADLLPQKQFSEEPSEVERQPQNEIYTSCTS
ncbi:MAG: TDP-N-acetylfucosamine:lipid II N-acetylfucosaminyltransferase [Synergistes jonesii]|uniref:TDP-N-acetylfucosamine:lipid II N-acetylfucosaminyltransferase n=1 Tax=Synergistes jonesii TaxID=2754 RepID=UPI002A75A399|nr:TDP-N-acetylfucosamine:lipid II N-acetylfucosaminyltransferase [Synergistes jonesii]MDY2984829.1 TDP-N-acetylfucosamine:lipid II N-acetylfucosaminyltransferase [Synergistes jonesii]